MTDEDKSPISRRRALIGLGAIGAAAVLGGVGTHSFYNDRETINATFNAGFPGGSGGGGGTGGGSGEINLVINWVTTFNGEVIDQDEQDNNVETDESSNTLRVQNEPMIPGDEGAIYVALRLEGSGGSVGFQVQSGNFQDNGKNAAEAAAEDPWDEQGELQEAVDASVARVSSGPSDETVQEQYYDGTVEGLEDGISVSDIESLQEGEVVWLAYYWSFTNDPGNEHQTDSYDVEMSFNAETV